MLKKHKYPTEENVNIYILNNHNIDNNNNIILYSVNI